MIAGRGLDEFIMQTHDIINFHTFLLSHFKNKNVRIFLHNNFTSKSYIACTFTNVQYDILHFELYSTSVAEVLTIIYFDVMQNVILILLPRYNYIWNKEIVHNKHTEDVTRMYAIRWQ